MEFLSEQYSSFQKGKAYIWKVLGRAHLVMLQDMGANVIQLKVSLTVCPSWVPEVCSSITGQTNIETITCSASYITW